MNTITPFFIMSAYKDENTEQVNQQLHEKLRSALYDNKLSFKEVKGVYKDSHEKAFLIRWEKYSEDTIQKLMEEYDQEAYVFVEASGYGALYDRYGQPITEMNRFRKANGTHSNYVVVDGQAYTL